MEREIMFYICVPIYKAEKYIHRCITSVLNQTYGNFKLILVDDGSPDKCGEICDEYAKQDDRVVVIHQKNMGLIAARQTANHKVIEINKKENAFVLCLDADDSLKNYALDTIRTQLVKHSCDMLIYGMDRTQNGKILDNAFSDEYTGVIESKKSLYHLVLEESCYNALWRKAVFYKMIINRNYEPFFAIKRGEDLLQSLPYYKASKKVVFIKDRLYNYEVNPNSITQSIQYENYHINSTVQAEALRFLREENVWDKADYNRYFRHCRKLLLREVRMISMFDTAKTNRHRLYDEVLADDYYSFLLNETRPIGFVLTALKKRQYPIVESCFKVRSALGKIRKAARKIISSNKGRSV